jgi:hypothetical protein
MSDEQHPSKNRRRSSGSENRFRQTRIVFRVSVDEHDEIKARAAAGLTVGSFLRGLALPAPRVRPARRYQPMPPLIWPVSSLPSLAEVRHDR